MINLDRREVLKLAGVLAAEEIARRIGLFDQRTASAAARILSKDAQITNEALLPANWPQDTASAAKEFGGNSAFYRRDLWVDASGNVQWDGTWVAECYPLKVAAVADGGYVDANGRPLSEDQIYVFGGQPQRIDFRFGQFADGMLAHGTAWDGSAQVAGGSCELRGGLYMAAYGLAAMHGEQAVIRPIEPGDPNPLERGRRETAIEFGSFIANDKHRTTVAAALWDAIEGTYNYVFVVNKTN